MRTEKKRSNTVTIVTADVMAGILTFAVEKAGAFDFNVRQFVGQAAYDGLTENGKFGILHGFEQKIRDRAAIEKNPKTGQSASPTEKYEAMHSLMEHLLKGGEWTMKGGGPRPLDRASLYVAVALARNRNSEDVERVYRDKPDMVLRTLLADPKIAAEYAALTVRGDQSQAEALLAEMDAEPEGEDEESDGATAAGE